MSTEKSARDTAHAAAAAVGIKLNDRRRARFVLGFKDAIEGMSLARKADVSKSYNTGYDAGLMDLRAQAFIASTGILSGMRRADRAAA